MEKSGVVIKYVKAFDLYMTAAELGFARAQYRVGQCYAAKRGAPQDKKAAFSWFLQSAEQGYAPAQNITASCYWQGYGVEKNIETAIEWYRIAAEQGYAPAVERYEQIKKS